MRIASALFISIALCATSALAADVDPTMEVVQQSGRDQLKGAVHKGSLVYVFNYQDDDFADALARFKKFHPELVVSAISPLNIAYKSNVIRHFVVSFEKK